VTDDLTVTGVVVAVAGTLSVTNAEVIAVASSYIQITPTEISTCTVANASVAGQILIIENVGTNNLVLSDNGTTLALGGAVTLGTTDTVGLIANAAAQWRRLWTADN
jgi:hypothetical protein